MSAIGYDDCPGCADLEAKLHAAEVERDTANYSLRVEREARDALRYALDIAEAELVEVRTMAGRAADAANVAHVASVNSVARAAAARPGEVG